MPEFRVHQLRGGLYQMWCSCAHPLDSLTAGLRAAISVADCSVGFREYSEFTPVHVDHNPLGMISGVPEVAVSRKLCQIQWRSTTAFGFRFSPDELASWQLVFPQCPVSSLYPFPLPLLRLWHLHGLPLGVKSCLE